MSKKRLGRGYGSGKGGHTTGRGQKGQKSRRKIHILFEGLKVKKSVIKKLPLLRGRGKFSPKVKPVIININSLGDLKKGQEIDLKFLLVKGLVSKKEAVNGVKILGKSSLKKDLIFKIPVSLK